MGVGALTKRFVFWEWRPSEECACVHTCGVCTRVTVHVYARVRTGLCVCTYVTACACVCSCDFLCRRSPEGWERDDVPRRLLRSLGPG